MAGQAVVDIGGAGPVTYTTDTSAVTGNFKYIQCITDTVFSVFTRTNATGSLTGITIAAGTVLFGHVSAYTLTSGAVAAYS